MEIDIASLQKESDILNKQLEKFTDSFLNIYNDLNQASNDWQDYHARFFFTNVNTEKSKVNNTYKELIALQEIYLYLVNQYKVLGNKINVNLDNKDDIFSKFNNFKEKLDELVSMYNDLDLSFCPDEAAKINSQKKQLLKIKSDIYNSKDKIKETLEKIEEIEKEVNLRISKINIEEIQETNINEFI